MRDQIWNLLHNLRFKSYCIALLASRYQKRERTLNIILAVASSGSIAAWAIWDFWQMVWPAIIAISQVITVLKPYFPYSKYVGELNAKCSKAEMLNHEIERIWLRLNNGKATEDEAFEAYFEIKKQMVEIFAFNDDSIYTVDTKILKGANEKMITFQKHI